jgi:hypothetical protein
MTNYCGNCAFYTGGECHAVPPTVSHGDIKNWSRVDATDWCGHWATGVGYAGTSTLTWGTADPSGGNNGDYYLKNMNYLQQQIVRVYQNTSGTWTQIGTVP